MKREYSYVLPMIMVIVLVLLIDYFYPASEASQTISNDPVKTKVESIVNTWLKDNIDSNFNGIILVAKDGKELYSYTSGYANYEKKEMIDADTAFQLGSISKPFTAMGIMVLYEQGKIDLDDSITKYLPELSYKDITIRHLLTHTSGIPDYMGAAGAIAEPGKPITNNDLIKAFEKRSAKPLIKPGERFFYSNTGYVLLTSIIERVSGLDFGKFMRINVFEPMDMNNSAIYDATGNTAISNRAYGYGKDGQFYMLDVTRMDGMAGFANQYSSANDLLKWDEALRSTKLLKQSTLDMMFVPYKLTNGKFSDYGLGWFTGEINNKKIASHTGGWDGFYTYFARRFNDNYTIICLNNVQPNDHVNKALDELFMILAQ